MCMTHEVAGMLPSTSSEHQSAGKMLSPLVFPQYCESLCVALILHIWPWRLLYRDTCQECSQSGLLREGAKGEFPQRTFMITAVITEWLPWLQTNWRANEVLRELSNLGGTFSGFSVGSCIDEGYLIPTWARKINLPTFQLILTTDWTVPAAKQLSMSSCNNHITLADRL